MTFDVGVEIEALFAHAIGRCCPSDNSAHNKGLVAKHVYECVFWNGRVYSSAAVLNGRNLFKGSSSSLDCLFLAVITWQPYDFLVVCRDISTYLFITSNDTRHFEHTF